MNALTNTSRALASKKQNALAYERLTELLKYDQETGVFTWTKVTTNKVACGDRAGMVSKRGYIVIGIDRLSFTGHRLAWFYVHKQWPIGELDHIDRNRTNNSISNLRPATTAENAHNSGNRKNNTSGIRGVSWDKKYKKWMAKICLNKKQIYIGHFASKLEAAAAYGAAQVVMHPSYVPSSNDQRLKSR